MKKITSFCVDHDHLEKGMYVSREDGDVITYDLRMVKPNQGGYLENAGLHTLEHLFATYVRNTEESGADGLPHRLLPADERYAVQSTCACAGTGDDGVHRGL